jgi:hypothetical protein
VNSSGRWARGALAAALTLHWIVALPARADEAPPAAGDAEEAAPEPSAPSGEGSPEATDEETGLLDEDAEELHPVDEIGGMVVDALVLRPLGAGASVVGFAAFVIAAPLTWPGGNLGNSWDLFVIGPYEYTFVRPLGDF